MDIGGERVGDEPQYRRIVYSSIATSPRPEKDLLSIFASSRRNNGMDGISGLLWLKGGMFLQLLEGPYDSVGDTFDRIVRDERHRDIRILMDAADDRRLFPDWSMANLPSDPPADSAARLQALLRDKPEDLVRLFADSF